jgi:S-DNA-T family DNA segregation ATPase FtsK/SpoIIIE
VLAEAVVHDRSPLMLAIGKDVAGGSVVEDLTKMPHLLIAGSTGTGKSVCINALLMSILMRATPAEVRLILIDPKRIELSLYNGLPHLYVPVVTEAKEAASGLAWAVSEMEARLRKLQKAGARNIGAYNALAHEGKLPEGMEEMPYIVIVIDELADLMMVMAPNSILGLDFLLEYFQALLIRFVRAIRISPASPLVFKFSVITTSTFFPGSI